MTGLVTLLSRTLQPLPHLTRSQVSPQVLGTTRDIDCLYPSWCLTDLIACKVQQVWAVPISLATTLGIAVAFSSSRY